MIVNWGVSALKGIHLLLWLVLGLVPVATVQAAELKIGAVSIAKVLSEAPQAKQANERLQKEFSQREKSLLDEEKALKNIQQKLTKDKAVMSESQQRNLERDYLTRARDWERAMGEFREDFNLRRNEELGKFQKQVVDAINSLAKEEGFDLILSEGGVVYAGEKIDITDKVLKRLSGQR